MKNVKKFSILISCFIMVSALLSPVARAALITGSPESESVSELGGTGLAPAVPPNMENSSGKTAFASGETGADRDFRTDVFAVSRNSDIKELTIYTGILPERGLPGTGARFDRHEVMLC